MYKNKLQHKKPEAEKENQAENLKTGNPSGDQSSAEKGSADNDEKEGEAA